MVKQVVSQVSNKRLKLSPTQAISLLKLATRTPNNNTPVQPKSGVGFFSGKLQVNIQ